jgi:hypothetical protein
MCIRSWTRYDDILAAAFGIVLVVGMVFGGMWLWRSLTPMSDVYELFSVAVDTKVRATDPINVNVLKIVKRDFPGHYITAVRPVDGPVAICSGRRSEPFFRQPPLGAEELPQAALVPLDDWTAGAQPPCRAKLMPGNYILTSCIHDDTGGLVNFLWPRFVCKDSNLFEVIP